MEYTEAKKQVQATKPKENFMVIKLGYDNTLVLPYKDGLALMASLANAERIFGSYDSKRIVGLDRSQQTTEIMSPKEYERHKIAALLNISFSELEKLDPLPF